MTTRTGLSKAQSAATDAARRGACTTGLDVHNTGDSRTDHVPSLGDFEGVKDPKPRYSDWMYQ